MQDIIHLKGNYQTRILFRDGLFLLADKPSGLPVHETKDPGRPDFTRLLAEALNLPHVRCANRLDLLTTGIVVIGLDPGRNTELDTILKNSRKFYLAEVSGRPVENSFKIESFLKDGNRKVTTVRSGGKKAITLFNVLSYNKKTNTSVIEAELITGRRHQIRIHLSEAGFPILGDPVYGKQVTPALMHLHAWKLVLPEETYNNLVIECPPPAWTTI